MNWPEPRVGMVIRYSYLWDREAKQGREEGIKDRPCAIILAVRREDGDYLVRALPITHSEPENPAHSLEIPQPTKKRLGLDSERSWIVLSESNDFFWPGPDLRPLHNSVLSSVTYGDLPPAFLAVLRQRVVALWRERQPFSVKRTE